MIRINESADMLRLPGMSLAGVALRHDISHDGAMRR